MTEFDKRWNMKYEKLVEFKRQNDHCIVPLIYEQDKSLAQWVRTQRTFHSSNKLRQDRKERLDEIGLAWKLASPRNINDKLWHQQYEKLVEFKRRNGHCTVPFKYQEDKSLGQWVQTQRICQSNNKLGIDRKERLDEIGFAWKNEDADANKLWYQQYEKLVEFKRKSGHCMVPCAYEQDKSLGKWVSRQRTVHINNRIRLDRKRILDEIGFAWKDDRAYNDKLWRQQYEKLVEFKRKSGHCMGPCAYEQDRSLRTWASKQRQLHSKNKMRPDRKKLLDALQFVWMKAHTHAPVRSSSTTNVRILVVGLLHALGRSRFSLSFFFCFKLQNLFRIRIWKRSRAVWFSQAKRKKGNEHESTAVTKSSGTSNMKSWSNLNEREDIVWCQIATSKMSL
jgi:hypothetical protein